MLQALQPAAENSNDARTRRPGTRPDAIVFAWLLDLPAEMNSADAARAVLDATRANVSKLNPYQRSVLAELVKLMRKEESGWTVVPSEPAKRKFRGRRKRTFFSRESRPLATGRTEKFVCLSGGRDQSDDSGSDC